MMTHQSQEVTSVADGIDSEKLKRERAEGKKALAELTRPIAVHLMVARVLAAISSFLAIGPYFALVALGDVLITAYDSGEPIDATRVWFIINVLVATFGLRLLITAVALGIAHFADARLALHIRQRTIQRVGQAPLGWFTATNAGKLRKSLHDDIAQIHTLIAHQPVDVTQAVVTPIALVVYAFFIDWRLGLLTVASLPFYVIAMVWTMKDMSEKTIEMDHHLSRVSSTMVEFFTGITVVKAFGTVGKAHGRYQAAADDFSRFYLAWVTPLLRGSALGNAAIAIPVILLINLAGGAVMVQAGWVSVAEVLGGTLIALVVPSSVEVLGGMSWAYQLAGAAALRVVTALDTPTVDTSKSGEASSAYPVDATVVYDNVSFSYGDTLAVDQVSMTLRPGTVTALVGPSGSGKSTLAMLLARFNDPDSGAITLGGVDLKQIPPAELYRHVAFVLQDPQLLGISIRDNIALAKPDASDEQVKEAARKAHILDTIEALPQGFDTIYGQEHGLSGGQAQRIAIARAVLLDAPVLILDEATAFADPESEAEIQQALTDLVQGRTVLVIAHRPESIIGVDHIVIVNRGAVVAQGSHEQLLGQPIYSQLWRGTHGSNGTLTTTVSQESE
jgi:hypothetical protein